MFLLFHWGYHIKLRYHINYHINFTECKNLGDPALGDSVHLLYTKDHKGLYA